MLFQDTAIRNISKKACTMLLLSSLFVQIIAPVSVFADESVSEAIPAPVVEQTPVSETPAVVPESVAPVTENTNPAETAVSPNTEPAPITSSTVDASQNIVSGNVDNTTSNPVVGSSTPESVIENNPLVQATTTESVSTSTIPVDASISSVSSAEIATTTQAETHRVASQESAPVAVPTPQREVVSEAKFFVPKPVVVPVPAFVNNVSISSSTNGTGLMSRAVVTSNGLTQGGDEIVAPVGAKYAVIKAWGASGGAFGNDNYSNQTYAVDGVPTQNAQGGFGAYVSGVIEINPSEKLVVSPGLGGYSGYRKHDNNDIWGFPGASTTVSFKGQEIIVAGAGAPLANGALSLDGKIRVYINSKIDAVENQKLLNDLIAEFSNGGSLASKGGANYLTNTDVWYKKLTDATVKLGIPMWPVEGGNGFTKGAWKFKEVAGKYVVGGLTGGSSYVASSVIKPVLYSGDPARNTYDEGAWNTYLKSILPAPAQAVALTNRSGGGAVIVEFWSSLPNTPDGPVDPVIPTVVLSASIGGTSVNASTTVPVGATALFSWSFSNVPSGTSCSLVKNSTEGTPFTDIGAISPSSSITSTSTGALVAGTYLYTLSCGNGVTSSVSFTVPQPVTGPVFNTVLTATPATLGVGATSTLVWVTSNTTSCVASNGSNGWVGPKPISGSFVVGPILANTTYTLTCTGPTGIASSSNVVIAFNPGGTASTTPSFIVPLTASVNPIVGTGSSTLVWSSMNTNSCIASNGSTGWFGTKATSGTFNVTGITATTTFNIDCVGVNGTTTSTLVLGFTSNTVVPVTPVVPVVPPTSGGGGGRSGGPCIGYGCPTTVVTPDVTAKPDILIYIDTPVVTPSTTKSCPAQDFITQYLKIGVNNNPNEVRKLKYFLNTYEETSLTVNGDFDTATEEAVKAFQVKYSNDILSPWNTLVPTGIVYITTKAHINKIFCGANPDFRSDDDIKDILVDDVFKNNTVNPDEFKNDVGFNTATSTASSSVPLQDSGNLASAFFALEKVLKDISWYTIIVLLLLIIGFLRMVYANYIKDKNKPVAQKAMRGGVIIFGVGLFLSVFNSLSFILAPLWLLAVLGIGIVSVIILDTVALICILILFVLLLLFITKEDKKENTFVSEIV